MLDTRLLNRQAEALSFVPTSRSLAVAHPDLPVLVAETAWLEGIPSSMHSRASNGLLWVDVIVYASQDETCPGLKEPILRVMGNPAGTTLTA